MKLTQSNWHKGVGLDSKEQLAWTQRNLGFFTSQSWKPACTLCRWKGRRAGCESNRVSGLTPRARVVCTLSRSVVSNSLWPRGLRSAGSSVHGILQARTRPSAFPFPTPADPSYDSTWLLPPRFVIKTEGMGWRKLASCSDPADPLMGGKHCSPLGAGGWKEPHSQGPEPTTVFIQDGLHRGGALWNWKGHSFFPFHRTSWHAESPGAGIKPKPSPGQAWHLNCRRAREVQRGASGRSGDGHTRPWSANACVGRGCRLSDAEPPWESFLEAKFCC